MVLYLKPIDSHVHLRWKEYAKTPFAKWAFEDAKTVGLLAVMEMPNTNPPLTNLQTLEKRKRIIEGLQDGVSYGTHIAFTPNRQQQNHALEVLFNGGVDWVNSDKTFYVHSTRSGEIEITNPEEQKATWQKKARNEYKGVSIGHFEDGDTFTGTFDYKRPESHSERQNPEAELVQIERQLVFADEAGFEGTFYIAHTSNPDSVDFVEKMRPNLNFKVVMEVTPHHMFLNVEEDYPIHGNFVKMNPPLRPKVMQEKLLEYVLNGKFDVIATDHAPHPYELKRSETPPSGIPGIPIWPKAIEILRSLGAKEDLIERMCFDNPNRLFFNGKIRPEYANVEYDPSLWDKYGINPYSRIDGSLK